MFDPAYPLDPKLPTHLGNPNFLDLFGEQEARGNACPICGYEATEDQLVRCIDCGQLLCPNCVENEDFHLCDKDIPNRNRIKHS